MGGVYCENCDIALVKTEELKTASGPYAVDPATATAALELERTLAVLIEACEPTARNRTLSAGNRGSSPATEVSSPVTEGSVGCVVGAGPSVERS